MDDHIIFIEACLKKYSYPKIYAMNMANIFGASNRIFLLSWLYSLIQDNSSCHDLLSEETLGNFLEAYGFCKHRQTKDFINSRLDYPIQLGILYRIFKTLDLKHLAVEDNSEELTLKVLENFSQKDANIFKCFGSINLGVDVNSKSTNNREISEQLRQEQSPSFVQDTHFCTDADKVEKMLHIEENTKASIKIIHDLLKGSKGVPINFGTDEYDALKEFNENIDEIKKYIRNVELISKFCEVQDIPTSDLALQGNDNSFTKMAEEVIQLIQEIDKI